VHANIWKFRKESCTTLLIQIHNNKNSNEKYFLIRIFIQKKPQKLQKLDISLTNCLYTLNKCISMHTLANSMQSNDLHGQLWVFSR